jgi:hypothetical protein
MEFYLYDNIIYTGNQSHSPLLCVSNYLEKYPNIVILKCRSYVTRMLIDSTAEPLRLKYTVSYGAYH